MISMRNGNTAQLMKERMDRGYDCYEGVSDAIAYQGYGYGERVKIILDFDLENLEEGMIREGVYNPYNVLLNGFASALPLTKEGYDSLEGEEFIIKKLGRLNGLMAKEEVRESPIWNVLARDQRLLKDYTDYVFAMLREKKGYHTGMSIHLDLSTQAEPGTSNNYVDCPKLWYFLVEDIEFNDSSLKGKYVPLI